jgi:hypothetical protein
MVGWFVNDESKGMSKEVVLTQYCFKGLQIKNGHNYTPILSTVFQRRPTYKIQMMDQQEPKQCTIY